MEDETCGLCGHLWVRHDPEDGKCDVADFGSVDGACQCGRDLGWMQTRIARRSKGASYVLAVVRGDAF